MSEKERQYCSQHSSEAGEPLIGSIAPAQTLILLEYNDEWGAKAFEESHLPAEVKAHLGAALQQLSAPKLLLIKSHRPGAGRLFLVANLRPERTNVYLFRLERDEELCQLPLAEIVADAPAFAPYLYTQPLLLVCTNGRRDVCCAKFGFHVYQELARLSPPGEIPSVWEVSHVGGHRFAPNVLCLPQGAMYGRLGIEQAATLWESCRADRLLLEHLRGRLCFPEPVQASEFYLRQFTGRTETSAYHLRQIEEIAPRQWQVRWQAPGGQQYIVRLRAEKFTATIYESCAFDKVVQPDQYHLIDIQASED